MNALYVLPAPADQQTPRKGVPSEREIFDARIASARTVARKRLLLRLGLGAVRRQIRRARKLAMPVVIVQNQPS